MGRKIGVNLKIDVTKIDKSKLFKGKNGNMYLDAQVFIDLDEQDQYGNNGMVTQAVSKEERASGVKGNILGNTRKFWGDYDSESTQKAAPVKSAPVINQPPMIDLEDDIPFSPVGLEYSNGFIHCI